ncbi:hypothetical protein OBBRIDRAFT_808450 [Obba rivulosa]|uniref:DUF6589 domain-containing protein n=1 Tax=Obba rivulosa TaxID=1052685 RepID=A0A8E2DEQ1_9APHY|nr:hypothetical protein OBBRIDRAFT_808450 [Obba rivulosa]
MSGTCRVIPLVRCVHAIYKAQGSNSSWEWLEMISPCIDILRQLATQINGTLGSKQGSKHHAPELEKDILELYRSMREHNIYQVERGRTVDYKKDGERAAVPNIVLRTKGQRRLQPLIGKPIVSQVAGAGEISTARLQGSSHETGCMVAEQHKDEMGASIEEDDEDMVSDKDKDMEMEMGEWDDTRIDELLALETEEDVALDMDDF